MAGARGGKTERGTESVPSRSGAGRPRPCAALGRCSSALGRSLPVLALSRTLLLLGLVSSFRESRHALG